MDVEQRLQQLEDRAAINDLVVEYFLAADGDDLQTLGNCFTNNATFSSSGTLNGHGRNGIVDFIREARAHMGLTVHTPNYVHIKFNGMHEAKGLVGAHLELVLGGTSIFGPVRYVDAYVRENGRWLIAQRDMRTIYMAPWLSVGEALESKEPVRWPGAKPLPSDYPRQS